MDFILGLVRNERLEEALEPAFERAEALCAESGQPERVYDELLYRIWDSWSRLRRVIGKAEITRRGPNPRFVVTSLSAAEMPPKQLYEEGYCPRGEMENRIKEQQLDLFATRTPARRMAVNQVRLWLASLADTVFSEIRRFGLRGTNYARALSETIRKDLFRIGAHVRTSVRRVAFSLSSSYPRKDLFATVYDQLRRAGPLTK